MVDVKVNGRIYPAAANFNAVAAYLGYVGRDTIDGLVNIDRLSPSDCTALVAACVNEGLRQAGKDERITPDDVGASPESLVEVPAAVAAIFKELSLSAFWE
jgi:hypothetical protein